jgi:hypothetical protein
MKILQLFLLILFCFAKRMQPFLEHDAKLSGLRGQNVAETPQVNCHVKLGVL